MAVIVSILVRVALVSRKGGSAGDYVPILVLSAVGLAVALLDFQSEKFRRTAAGPVITVALDILLIGSLYALSHDPRSDAFLLFALPLFIAADEFSRQFATYTLALTLGTFGMVVFGLVPAPNAVQQSLAIFVPRSIFLTILMAAWASAVRSLGIKEWQLVQVVELNDELSRLEREKEIASAVSLSASQLTFAPATPNKSLKSTPWIPPERQSPV